MKDFTCTYLTHFVITFFHSSFSLCSVIDCETLSRLTTADITKIAIDFNSLTIGAAPKLRFPLFIL